MGIDKLDELKAIAEKATPGPWHVLQGAHGSAVFAEEECIRSKDEDAIHIAAFDPPTVLGLIARARRAERLEYALEIFNNRRKLAYSLREDARPIYAFVEAIGEQIDAALKEDSK